MDSFLLMLSVALGALCTVLLLKIAFGESVRRRIRRRLKPRSGTRWIGIRTPRRRARTGLR